jgi:hypothetical protein
LISFRKSWPIMLKIRSSDTCNNNLTSRIKVLGFANSEIKSLEYDRKHELEIYFSSHSEVAMTLDSPLPPEFILLHCSL